MLAKNLMEEKTKETRVAANSRRRSSPNFLVRLDVVTRSIMLQRPTVQTSEIRCEKIWITSKILEVFEKVEA